MKNTTKKIAIGGAVVASLLVGALGGAAGASSYLNDNTVDLVSF
ncbi:hypothetical protein Bcp1_230 [Bacillus phage Bcp1]|nr:hypothetical protein Bcp1_230 [Bacillus phage Bcp1]AHZ60323.1 hypothetical protein Bcp1_230 [Bacillus phage Bcp1]